MSTVTIPKKEVVTGSATYEGETKINLKHGKGALTWDDGDSFTGEFENDEKVFGTFIWKVGDQYVGSWKNSLMHGKGTYTYRNARKYEGDWVCGFKEGTGKMTWPNGDKYEGSFHRDYCHGVGTQTYADGRVYRGNWFENKKHGFGIIFTPTGEKTQGYWNMGQLNDNAIITELNGTRYQERWRNGTKESERILLKRKEDDMKALLKTMETPKWIDDYEFKGCYTCNAQFNMLNRRHHCRHCGYIFCGECTTKKTDILRFHLSDPVRVCDECFTALHVTEFENE